MIQENFVYLTKDVTQYIEYLVKIDIINSYSNMKVLEIKKKKYLQRYIYELIGIKTCYIFDVGDGKL